MFREYPIGEAISRWAVLAMAIFAIAACADPGTSSVTNTEPDGQVDIEGLFSETLFDANDALFDHWQLVPIRGKGNWVLMDASDGQGLSIRGEAQQSASAIMRHKPTDPLECPVIEWQWMAETTQKSADLTSKDKDDVAAGLFVLFGDPGTLADPNRVPTLRYVWTAGPHRSGDVIPNPYMPDLVRNIVVVDGTSEPGLWRTERRDMAADFEAAFGHLPNDFVHAVALFVDNDQTKEPAAARFRSAIVYCN